MLGLTFTEAMARTRYLTASITPMEVTVDELLRAETRPAGPTTTVTRIGEG